MSAHIEHIMRCNLHNSEVSVVIILINNLTDLDFCMIVYCMHLIFSCIVWIEIRCKITKYGIDISWPMSGYQIRLSGRTPCMKRMRKIKLSSLTEINFLCNVL